MPYIHVQTNVPVTAAEADTLKTRLGQAIPALPGKSEKWLMVRVESECAMWFAGSDDPCAMAEVAVYGGAPSEAYEAMTARICQIFRDTRLGLERRELLAGNAKHDSMLYRTGRRVPDAAPRQEKA